MSDSMNPRTIIVDPIHLTNLRDRLKKYRQRHSAVLKKEQEQERIEKAEAETRKRLQELLDAEKAQKLEEKEQNRAYVLSSDNNIIPPQFLSNAFSMVSEKEAINWLKANPHSSSTSSSPSPSSSNHISP